MTVDDLIIDLTCNKDFQAALPLETRRQIVTLLKKHIAVVEEAHILIRRYTLPDDLRKFKNLLNALAALEEDV